MAERRTKSSSSNDSDSKSTSNGNGGGSSRSRRRLSARDVASGVREDLSDLLGRRVEAVLGIEPDDDGGWIVTVSVVELQRIPNSTDVLGAYRVSVDEDGEVIGYRRQRRYVRSQADED